MGVRAGPMLATEPFGLVNRTLTLSNGPHGMQFVVVMQGCNFDCVVCSDPDTIDPPPAGCPIGALPAVVQRRTVDGLLAELHAAPRSLAGVTVAGGEATLQSGFVRSLFEAVKADAALAHLRCFVASNGAAPRSVWTSLSDVMDGAVIELKSLDPTIHRALTGRANDAVLESIRLLDALGQLYEVRIVIVPGVNDDRRLLEETAQWLADVDPMMRVTLVGFRRQGVRAAGRELREPSTEQMLEYEAAFADRALFRLSVD